MAIVTNPGSNLPPAAVRSYGIILTPQQIVVDDTPYDTRQPIALNDIDGWVSGASVHPYVVGTTAAEFASVFRDAAQRNEPVVAVMTSRKIIKSYDAAQSALRSVLEMPGGSTFDAVVADSGVTDVGAGMATILAAEAERAGHSPSEIAPMIDAFRGAARFVFTVRTLDYLVKGGRATPLRAWLANLLNVRPVIAFVDGELAPVQKIKASSDYATGLLDYLAGQVPLGERVWAGVFHGQEPDLARRTLKLISERWTVEWGWVQPLSPSIYLHGGPGSLGVVLVPLSALPWQPPSPHAALFP